MGDRLRRVVLIGVAAGEDDMGRDPVALGETEHVLARLGRVHVIDAQIQGRADLELRQHADGGDTAGSVHQRGDGTTVDHPAIGVADDMLAVGQTQGQAFGAGRVHLQAEHLAMTQGRQKALSALQNGGSAHPRTS